MRGGSSGCTGLMLYDTSKKGDNAVFGYYKGEIIELKVGPYDSIKAFKDEMEEEFEQDGDSVLRTMFKVFLKIVVLIVVGFVVLPFFRGMFLMLIFVLAYFPLLGLEFANSNIFKTEELQKQFRRFHGSEHAALNLNRHKKDLTLENLKNESIFNMECGTMYMGYSLFLLVVIALLGLNIGVLGFAKALLLLFGVVVIVIINILLPKNPFVLFQKKAVSKPTDREYLLALAVAKKLEEL